MPNRAAGLPPPEATAGWGATGWLARTVLGEPVRGEFSRVYCGGGKPAACAKALVRSLKEALRHMSDAELYPDGPCENGDAQWCHDAIEHTATGAITQPPIHWIDRPTFQQAVQIGK